MLSSLACNCAIDAFRLCAITAHELATLLLRNHGKIQEIPWPHWGEGCWAYTLTGTNGLCSWYILTEPITLWPFPFSKLSAAKSLVHQVQVNLLQMMSTLHSFICTVLFSVWYSNADSWSTCSAYYLAFNFRCYKSAHFLCTLQFILCKPMLLYWTKYFWKWDIYFWKLRHNPPFLALFRRWIGDRI